MMRVGAVVLLIGMLAGMVMGIQQDFPLARAQAHLNQAGSVLLFLFGLHYRLVPTAGSCTQAKVQDWLHIAGAILLPADCARIATAHVQLCGAGGCFFGARGLSERGGTGATGCRVTITGFGL